MKPTETLARAVGPDGAALLLTRRDGVYRLSVGGENLMSTRQHGSESTLAELACAHLPARRSPRMLIGGLGFGYTLRAALDRLPPEARVVICELFPLVITANQGEIGELTGRPLEDRRVTLVEGDVRGQLDGKGGFDAILLDVDNGPRAFTVPSNEELYGEVGITRLRESLSERGVLALWSAEPAPEFERRLRRRGFEVKHHRVEARPGAPRRGHTIVIARRGAEGGSG